MPTGHTLSGVTLDPDDPRPPYVQVASAIRDAIARQRYAPGERLPSGSELAAQYNVARMTVQNAIRALRDEGLVVSRQGSGVYVRSRAERPVGLRPHVERAFERQKVSIDFAGFSGETLHGALQEPLTRHAAANCLSDRSRSGFSCLTCRRRYRCRAAQRISATIPSSAIEQPGSERAASCPSTTPLTSFETSASWTRSA